MRHEKHTFKFKGITAIVVLVAFLAVNLFRTFSSSAGQDEALTNILKYELGTQNSQNDLAAAVPSLDQENPLRSSIKLESVELSRKLFSHSTPEKVIVRVTYTLLSGATSRTKYYEFQHSAIAGWTLKWSSNAMLFYLNFI